MMTSYALATVRATLRSRVALAVVLFGVALVAVSYLAGSFSPRQPKTVALDVGLSMFRLTLLVLVLSWIQENVMRDIDRRTVLFLFAYPVSRTQYLAGRFVGIVLMSALAAVGFGLLLTIAVLAAGGLYEQSVPVQLGMPFWLTVLGLWIDVSVVASVAMAVASIATSQVMPLAVGLAFAAAGKGIGAVIQYLSTETGDKALVATYLPVLDAARWLLPDLSRLDWRDWTLYGLAPSGSEIFGAVVMALAYVVVMLATAGLMLDRRELS